MQRRQLDRHRRTWTEAYLGLCAYGFHGLTIVGHVLARVLDSQCRFAKHIEGIGVALFALGTAVLQRFGDGPAQHELLAHQLHRLVHRGANDRLAGTLDQAADDILWAAVGVFRVDHLAGHHQAPGSEVDQHVVALAEVAFPLGGIELVADQSVSGGRVRHAQQRFGQAHQHQAFVGVQTVLAQQRVEGVDGVITAAYGLDQATCFAANGFDARLAGVGELQQLVQVGRLVNAVIRADGGEEFGGFQVGEIALQDLTGFEHRAAPLVECCCDESGPAGRPHQ